MLSENKEVIDDFFWINDSFSGNNIEREQENARKAVQADIARLAIAAAEKIVKTGDRSDNTSSK